MSEILGLDIGGTGLKAAVVDTTNGKLITPAKQLATPERATPKSLATTLAELIRQFEWSGPVGIGYPGVVINGTTYSAAHLSDKWIEAKALELFSDVIPNQLSLINDADAAGLAEMAFGAGVDWNRSGCGAVLLLTFGTGIGSALFCNGQLFPNTELGHLLVGEHSAEDRAAGKIKTELKLSWPDWAGRLNIVLAEYEKLLSPELIIIGGGLSENYDQFASLINCRAEVVAARFRNDAGIVGAALHYARG